MVEGLDPAIDVKFTILYDSCEIVRSVECVNLMGYLQDENHRDQKKNIGSRADTIGPEQHWERAV
jgi:hypothetical protein